MKNSKVWKRMFAVALAGCLVAGCLTACGDSKATTTSESKSTTTSESTVTSESTAQKETESAPIEPEVVALSYWGGLESNAQATLTSLNDMEMLNIAQEKTYTDVTYFHPATGTEKEQFNLKLANLELEDIMEYNWISSYAGGPAQAIADGILIDLTPYIEQGYAPNFKKILDENPDIKKQISTDEGQIYAFPAIALKDGVNVSGGPLVRADLVEKVNMEMPVTIEDWEKLLTAYKEELGLASPFTGQTANLIGATAWFTGAYDTFAGYYLRDGKVQYGFIDDNFKEYLTTMNKWYENGLIDQDIFGNDGKIVNSNILNDKSGAMFGNIGSHIGTLTNSAKETNPTLKLQGVTFPVAKEGDSAKYINRSFEVRANNQAAITTACENIEAAMRYLDYFYSEEGVIAKNFGVEGVSYEMVNGAPVYTDEILKNPDGLSIAHALGKYTRASSPSVGIIDRRYNEQYYQLQEQVDAMNLWNTDNSAALEVLLPPITATSDESEELAIISESLNAYVQEECTKFIMGLRDISEFDDFVETCISLGAEDAIAIKQAGYDRYMAR